MMTENQMDSTTLALSNWLEKKIIRTNIVSTPSQGISFLQLDFDDDTYGLVQGDWLEIGHIDPK